MLPFAVTLPIEQGGQNSSHRMDASTHVTEANLRKDGSAIGETGHIEDAGIRGTDVVISR